MTEAYDHDEYMDEGGYSRSSPPQEDSVSSNLSSSSILRPRGKKPSKWVFISRRADIGIVLLLLLALGAAIMWFIARLPSYLETAEAHYNWAMEMYATWGTPSMRWLFIQLVVGIIVTTSGLLSAFGAGNGSSSSSSSRGGGSDRSLSAGGGGGASGGNKGRFYEGPHAPSYNHAAALLYQRNTNPSSPYDAISYNAGSTRFTGPGYESPVYNPYVKPVEDGLPSQNSLGAWVYEPQQEQQDDAPQSLGGGEMEASGGHEGGGRIHGNLEAPDGDDEGRDVNFAFVGHHPPGDVMTREIALPPRQDSAMSSSSREMHPPREMVLSRGMSIPSEENSPEDSDDVAPAEYDDVPEPEVEEYTAEKAYDSEGNEDYGHAHHHHHHRTKTEPSIHFDAPSADDDDEAVGDGVENNNISSPSKPGNLHKSHTFTIGRVIRRDQLVDFIEPLSRRLEGIGRKVRLDPHRSSSHGGGGDTSNTSRDGVNGADVSAALLAAAAEAGQGPGPVPKPHVADSASHRRRHSAEAMPAFTHRRRLSSESVPQPFGTENAPPPGNSRFPDPLQAAAARSSAFLAAAKPPPPPSASGPLRKQRSIVYPPALETSPPPSPPIEETILPPPPPPHLKLSTARDTGNSAIKSLLNRKKNYSKESETKQQQLPPKHSRTVTGSESAAATAAAQEAIGKSRGVVSESDFQEFKDTLMAKERQQDSPGSGTPVKDDDLHQKIEDFLARFHENWRLQRQESLARYKKRLSELDEE